MTTLTVIFPADAFYLIAERLHHIALDESGQDLIEYALIAAFIGLASVTGVNGIAAKISSALTAVYGTFDKVIANAVQ